MKVYKVTYWDPCNGIGGRAQEGAYFSSRRKAEAYIKPLAVGWDTNAYTIREIEVQ